MRSIANITPVVQVGTVKVPGPGEYDLREETVPKTGVKGFGQVFRFPTKQIFFGENFKNVPGPCRYRKDHDSLRKSTTRKRRSIKPNRSFGSSDLASTSARRLGCFRGIGRMVGGALKCTE